MTWRYSFLLPSAFIIFAFMGCVQQSSTVTTPEVVDTNFANTVFTETAPITIIDLTWETTVVDSTDTVGSHSALAFDQAGAAHITYRDDTNADLKYATNALGNWVTEMVASEQNVGNYSDIEVDEQGQPHICFYQAGVSLKYGVKRNGVWEIETVDDTGDVGAYCSLDLDSSGQVHISYYDWTVNDLRYAVGVPGNWLIEQLAQDGDIGTTTSLQVDQQDAVHIAYYEPEHFSEHYITNTTGEWVDVSMEPTPGFTSGDTKLAIGPDNVPHVVYDWQGDLHYATLVDGSWQIVTVDRSNIDQPAIAVTSDNVSYISFADFDYDQWISSLKVARRVNEQWELMTVVEEADAVIGKASDIGISPNGKIGISYYDQTNGDLIYAEATDAYYTD